MAEQNRFQRLVAEAKKNIREITPEEAVREVGSGAATLIDVREKDDWAAGRARGAKHLPRGEVELEIEELTRICYKSGSRCHYIRSGCA